MTVIEMRDTSEIFFLYQLTDTKNQLTILVDCRGGRGAGFTSVPPLNAVAQPSTTVFYRPSGDSTKPVLAPLYSSARYVKMLEMTSNPCRRCIDIYSIPFGTVGNVDGEHPKESPRTERPGGSEAA